MIAIYLGNEKDQIIISSLFYMYLSFELIDQKLYKIFELKTGKKHSILDVNGILFRGWLCEICQNFALYSKYTVTYI